MPYDASCVMKLLRAMAPARLATAHPHQFQTQPCDVVLPARILASLIDNEKARRSAR